MHIEEIINEDKRSRVITHKEQTIIRHLQRDCSEALAAYQEGRQIFKGITWSDEPVILSNPRLEERTSANTTNHYTLLLDNLPSWKGYPKRSRSLICSTAAYTAYNYGDLYIVLPVNGARIGICPTNDIWISFGYYIHSNLQAFNDRLSEAGVSDDSYREMLSNILQQKERICRRLSNTPNLTKPLKDAESISDVQRILDDVFNPKTNGFDMGDVSAIPKKTNREVWTDSRSYLICAKTNLAKMLLTIPTTPATL